MTITTPTTVNAYYVGRTLQTLELLATGAKSTSQVADSIGVHQQTARRLLKGLVGAGWARYDVGQRRYGLTNRMCTVALELAQGRD